MVAALQAKEPGGDGTLSRPVYDAPHAVRPWGWKVASYLWTKSIAAGALLVAAFGGWETLYTIAAPAVSLLFLLLTTALLILDLKRPDRFAYILLKPNWRSWLVWGAWILMAFGAAGGLWLLGGLGGAHGLIKLIALPTILLALAAAGYSAFLFGQAEGRDFWQSPLVLPHLIVAAIVAGTAALIVTATLLGQPGAAELGQILVGALLAHVALLALELFSRHPVRDVALAARLITAGALRARFWGGVMAAGVALPIVLLVAAASLGSGVASTLAALFALTGLWIWEDVWVKAGQSVPLS
jgi:formate-dependent nitrite reductase membrane component NrfD